MRSGYVDYMNQHREKTHLTNILARCHAHILPVDMTRQDEEKPYKVGKRRRVESYILEFSAPRLCITF
jgi:hypothetical protein